MSGLIHLIPAIILGIIAIVLAFKAKQYSIEETVESSKLNYYGLILLTAGFVIHIIGDMFFSYYGAAELLIESFAHVVILIAFLYFYKAAKHAVKKSERYWFK